MGEVSGEEIDSNGYIDQHYYAIAEKSTLTSGKDLPVNAGKFKETFGEDWSTVVAEGRAFNALEFKNKFADKYGAPGALDKAWDATSVDKKTRVEVAWELTYNRRDGGEFTNALAIKERQTGVRQWRQGDSLRRGVGG